MKDHFLEIVRYNLWANQRIIEVISQLDEDLIKKEIVNSFPSLQKTLFHIWDAQVIWFYRISEIPFTYLPSTKLEEPLEASFKNLIAESEGWVSFLEKQPASFFTQIRKYYTLSGEEKENSVHHIIHHCMNHSTYHRGQLVTLAKQLGATEMLSTDFMFYLNEKNSLA